MALTFSVAAAKEQLDKVISDLVDFKLGLNVDAVAPSWGMAVFTFRRWNDGWAWESNFMRVMSFAGAHSLI